MTPAKQTDPQYKLRMPVKLKEKIELVAKNNNRSMNAEIIARLEASFSADGNALLVAADAAASLRQSLTERIARLDRAALEYELRVREWQKRHEELDKRGRELVDKENSFRAASRETHTQRHEERKRREEEISKRVDAAVKQERERLTKRIQESENSAKKVLAREAELVELIKQLRQSMRR
jgi:hypothetical protein